MPCGDLQIESNCDGRDGKSGWAVEPIRTPIYKSAYIFGVAPAWGRDGFCTDSHVNVTVDKIFIETEARCWLRRENPVGVRFTFCQAKRLVRSFRIHRTVPYNRNHLLWVWCNGVAGSVIISGAYALASTGGVGKYFEDSVVMRWNFLINGFVLNLWSSVNIYW